MYRAKAFEARFCTPENKIDIAHWADIDEEYVKAGHYYTKDKWSMSEDDFLAEYEEVPGSML
jgi:hypothetical protein